MDVEISDETLRRIAIEPSYLGGHPKSLVSRFRRSLQIILAANDEKTLQQFKCLKCKKLRGRGKRRSICLKNGCKMVFRIEKGEGLTAVVERIQCRAASK